MQLLRYRVGISFGGLEEAHTASANGADEIRRLIGRSIELRRSPKLRRGIRLRDFGRLQLAYSTAAPSPCKQKRPRGTVFNRLILLIKSGAAEGIRTLAPNLGKRLGSIYWTTSVP